MDKMLEVEQKYWYSVVHNWMQNQEDWRYPDEATQGFLGGAINQQYMNDEIEYPVLRWRQLEDLRTKTHAK
jgi:hypothetical protein